MLNRRSPIYLLIVLILILSLGLGSSCIYINRPPQPPPSPPPPEVTAPTNPEWTLPPADGRSQSLPDFVSVVAKVKPSVVAITTEVITFDIFRGQSIQRGAGSGWIISEDGLIVTNNHVIEGAKSITVTLADGRALTAGIVGADALNDLAVLKVEGTNLPTAKLGDSSQLRIGDWVLAIGNALGLGISAKEGIISRLSVTVPISAGQTLFDLIETSAAINPGNSGGPLINMAGEVIGITSAKLAAVGIEGLGYAISSNTAKPIIEALVQQGYVVRPWLGVVIRTVDQSVALILDLTVDKGGYVQEVAPDSPADKAGLREGDVIVSLNGTEITTAQELVKAIHSSQIGQEVAITFWRGDTRLTASALLLESPAPPA